MIYYWVNTAETQDRHIEDVKNDYETGTFSCEVNDYLYIVRSTWLTFSLYMKYTLSFEYQNNLCIVKLHDINYIEPKIPFASALAFRYICPPDSTTNKKTGA